MGEGDRRRICRSGRTSGWRGDVLRSCSRAKNGDVNVEGGTERGVVIRSAYLWKRGNVSLENEREGGGRGEGRERGGGEVGRGVFAYGWGAVWRRMARDARPRDSTEGRDDVRATVFARDCADVSSTRRARANNWSVVFIIANNGQKEENLAIAAFALLTSHSRL